MNPTIKSKLIELLTLAKEIVKGGPGSGPRPGGGHAQEAADRVRRAGTVGGKQTTVTIDGKSMPSMSVFYQPTKSIGGSKSSESRLLGDFIKYNGASGNLRQIDPAGKSLIIQNKADKSHKTVEIRDPKIDWDEAR